MTSKSTTTAQLCDLAEAVEDWINGEGPLPETIKQRIEREIQERLEKARTGRPLEVKLQGCHWCDGLVRETPTKGRLECATCGAVSICGRQETITHVRRADGSGR